MNNSEVVELLTKGLKRLLQEDDYLFVHDLSEQSLSHKLAEYLQQMFRNYHVDCEYNRNMGNEKIIDVLKSRLASEGLLRENERINAEKSLLGEEIVIRAVLPDIIIHRRGSDTDNLCVIEIKKSTSRVPIKYDQLKLEHYTSDSNSFKYQLGIFLILNTEGDIPSHQAIKFYINGKEKNLIDVQTT